MQTPLFMTDLDQLRLRTLSRTLLARRGNDRLPGEDLRDLLDSAEVIPANAIAPDVVTMNSTVVCRGELFANGERMLTLVYPDRADSDQGRLSVLSPLGRALLGARAGETVEVETPGEGIRQVHIQRLAYQPEADGNWLL